MAPDAFEPVLGSARGSGRPDPPAPTAVIDLTVHTLIAPGWDPDRVIADLAENAGTAAAQARTLRRLHGHGWEMREPYSTLNAEGALNVRVTLHKPFANEFQAQDEATALECFSEWGFSFGWDETGDGNVVSWQEL